MHKGYAKLDSVINKIKKEKTKMTEPNKKTNKKKDRKCVPMDGLAGIAMLFVAVSIGYLVAMLWLLTRDWHYLVGGVPAALGAALYLLEKARS